MTLYEITDDMKALENLIEAAMVFEDGTPREPTQEERDAILEFIAETEESFRGKAERICKLRANLQREAEAYKAEEERLSRRRKTMENKAAALKMYLEIAMVKTKQEKFEAGLFRLRMQKNPPSVQILNGDLVPKDYLRVIPETTEIDKAKLKGAFEVGAYDWGAIVQNKSLRIE